MSSLTSKLKQFYTNQSGATAIEYGFLAALISLAIIVAAASMGDAIVALFNELSVRLLGIVTANGA